MPPSSVVALWKDPTRGLREISLDPGADGVVMSVAHTRARRRCADGRTPVDNAAGLVVAGVHQVTAVPGDPDRAPGPRGGHRRRRSGPPELTIVTAWAEAVAEAMEHAPERVAGVLADARPGGAVAPRPRPARAVRAAGHRAHRRRRRRRAAGGADDAVLAVARRAHRRTGDAPVALATAVCGRRWSRGGTSGPCGRRPAMSPSREPGGDR